MAITVGTVTSNYWSGGYPWSQSFSATVDSDTTAILLYVSTDETGPSWNPTVTIGGQAMSLIRKCTSASQGVIWCYGYVNASPNTVLSGSNTVSISKSDQYGQIGAAGVVCLSGTATSSPFEADHGTTGTNSSACSLTTSTADDLIIGGGFTRYNTETPSCTSPSGGTVTQIYSLTTGDHRIRGYKMPAASAGTHSMTFAATSSSNATGLIIVAVKPGAGGGGGTSHTKSLTASMGSWTGAHTVRVNKQLSATRATFTATRTVQVRKTRTATMGSFSGAVTKRTSHVMAATRAAFSASLASTRVFLRTLTASMGSFAAVQTRRTNKGLTAIRATFSAAQTRAISHRITAAQASFSGTLSRLTAHRLTATCAAFAGGVTKSVRKGLTATQSAFTALLTALGIAGPEIPETPAVPPPQRRRTSLFRSGAAFLQGLTRSSTQSRTPIQRNDSRAGSSLRRGSDPHSETMQRSSQDPRTALTPNNENE